MSRLTESTFRGQVLRAHVCCVCVFVREKINKIYIEINSVDVRKLVSVYY